MNEFTKPYQDMITVHGWTGTAATLGMTKAALEARVYEIAGNGMRVDTAMLIQAFSGTSHFANIVSQLSGGVYVPLPAPGPVGKADLTEKLLELHDELGNLARAYKQAIADGEIDARERRQLSGIQDNMHRTIIEFMTTMFQVHCRQPGSTVEAK